MLEHILRRMGFGASPAELAAWAGVSDRHRDRSAAQLRVAVDRSRREDRLAGIRRHHDAVGPAVFRQHADQRRAAALAVPHDPFAAPARREDGAVLAQPLRDRLQQDRRRRRPGARHAHDGQRSDSLAGSEPGQIQTLRQLATGSFPTHADGDGEGPGDDLLARQPAEHAHAAAGEFRPRDHGAVQPRHRQLHRAGRLCRGARVHRLQLADRRRSRQRHRQLLHVPLPARTITTPTPRSSPFAIYPDGGRIIPARAAGARRAGRAST